MEKIKLTIMYYLSDKGQQSAIVDNKYLARYQSRMIEISSDTMQKIVQVCRVDSYGRVYCKMTDYNNSKECGVDSTYPTAYKLILHNHKELTPQSTIYYDTNKARITKHDIASDRLINDEQDLIQLLELNNALRRDEYTAEVERQNATQGPIWQAELARRKQAAEQEAICKIKDQLYAIYKSGKLCRRSDKGTVHNLQLDDYRSS